METRLPAIISTSGTATEVTAFSVITDYEKGIKYPLADFNITPDIAIVDPELTERASRAGGRPSLGRMEGRSHPPLPHETAAMRPMRAVRIVGTVLRWACCFRAGWNSPLAVYRSGAWGARARGACPARSR